MARPLYFMFCNAVLYCLTLFTICNLMPTLDSQSAFFNTPEPVSIIQKLHRSTISHQASKSFHLNLEHSAIPAASFKKSALSEILIQSTVFSAVAVNFQLENSNFFYISPQIFVEHNSGDPEGQENCILTDSQGILEPGSSRVFGPLRCKFARNGRFSYTAYIISNNQIVDVVGIQFDISGPQLEISPVPYRSNKFQIKNVGDALISVTGLLFDDFSCYDKNLEINDCDSSFELIPGQFNVIEVNASPDGSTKLKKKLIRVQTSLGEVEAELDIHYPATISEPSFLLVAFSFVLLFVCANNTFLPVLRKKLVSSKKEEKICDFTFKKYSKPAFVSCQKAQVGSLEVVTKKCNSLDQNTMASETTDTHLNSPTNSLNSEDSSLEDDYFLDTYKTSGLFCRNSLNSYLNHLN